MVAATKDRYWDLETCGWVRHEPTPAVEIPAQGQPVEAALTTAVSAAEEADVRSE